METNFQTATEFENKNVHKVYNTISEHFSCTRQIVWPKVADFLESIESGSTIVDIGCGNGKNMGTRQDCSYIGIDTCKNLEQLGGDAGVMLI